MSRKPRRPTVPRAKPVGRSDTPALLDELNKAHAIYRQGHIHDAESAYKRILKSDKYCVTALVALGAIKRQQGDSDKALKFLDRAVKFDNSNLDLRLELARTYLGQGNTVRAESACRSALALDKSVAAHCLYAEICEHKDDIAAAVLAYTSALAIRNDNAEIHNNLGLARRRQLDFSAALKNFDRAIEINPRGLAARNNRGNTLKDLGRIDAAIEEYLRALDLHPKQLDTLFNLALSYQQNGCMTIAISRFEEIVEIAPDHELAKIQIVESMINLGDFEHAQSMVDQVLASHPQCARAWFLKASLRKYLSFDPTIFTPILDILDDSSTDEETSTVLHFALGKLFDDIDDTDRAFLHYDIANRMRRRRLSYDPTANRKLSAALINSPPGDWAALAEPPDDAPQLIFIVGMPRSGTTLVEQILSAHDEVTAAGEVDYFDAAIRRLDLSRSATLEPHINVNLLSRQERKELRAGYLSRLNSITPAAKTITDKTPDNCYYLGLIQSLFPDAKIVRCRRHPLAVCLSIYFQLFNSVDYAYDLVDIGERYLVYEKVMAHWQVVLDRSVSEIVYERLVGCPKEFSRQLLENCGLAWQQQCLNPQDSKRSINTMSRWQARQPVYRHAVNRWQRYDKHLGKLKQKLAPLLASHN